MIDRCMGAVLFSKSLDGALVRVDEHFIDGGNAKAKHTSMKNRGSRGSTA